MPSPERFQPEPIPRDVDPSPGPTVRSLIERVTIETGHPVVLRHGEPTAPGTFAQITYATGQEPHVVTLARENLPFADYLIAHELVHALRFFGFPPRNRQMAYVDERHQARALRTLCEQCRGNNGHR